DGGRARRYRRRCRCPARLPGRALQPLARRAGLFVSRLVFTQRLELRQSQALVMTPQLQQAIKMLQLSNLELAEFVEAEIEQNPLLEHAPREGEEGAPTADPDGTAAPEGDLLDLAQARAVDVAAAAAD